MREFIDIVDQHDYVDVLEESIKSSLADITEQQRHLIESNANNGFDLVKSAIDNYYTPNSLQLTDNDIGKSFYPASFYSMIVVPTLIVSKPTDEVVLSKVDNDVYYFKAANGKNYKYPESNDGNYFYRRIVFKTKDAGESAITDIRLRLPENWTIKYSFNSQT